MTPFFLSSRPPALGPRRSAAARWRSLSGALRLAVGGRRSLPCAFRLALGGRRSSSWLVVGALLVAVPASAQPAARRGDERAALRVIVVDQTGAAIVGAAVRVTPRSSAPIELATDNRGQALVPELATGSVQLHVEAPGFAPHDADVGLRRGNNNRTVTLRIASLQEELVVTDRDAANRQGNAFSTTLGEEELSQLPDDPDEFEDALRQMAGGDAVFQVNGFRGGRLPPKSQIRQVRFRVNAYAAENHAAGHTIVDVITKPGTTSWSGSANVGLRDDVLNARNAFAPTDTPEQFRRFSGGLFGPLRKERTSLFVNVDGNASYDSQTIVAETPGGRIADQVRRPVDRVEVTVGVEHALTKDQTLRFEYQRRGEERRNLGVGDFSLQDRAFSRETALHQVRGSATSIIGRSALNELRVQFKVEDTAQRSQSADPAIVVIDAFTRGGAGVASDRALKSLEVANNTDFTIRKHAFRAGVLLELGAYRHLDARNANGTFTFGSLEAFAAGRPNTYTRRLGDVETSFSQYQVGLYVQDDVRVSRNLSLSGGVRYEAQSHVDDRLNVMPRAGFSWNPFGWKATVRGGYGIFHDWFGAELYDQSLRVNGTAQRDLLVLNPGYPDPFSGAAATVLPGGRVEIATDLRMPLVHQFSIGAERTFADLLTVQGSYMRHDGRDQLRSINVNAPDAGGLRSQPDIGTVARIESTGRLDVNRLTVNANLRMPGTRTMLGTFYVLSSTRNHADTPLSLPADSRNPEAEWGPAAQDARHRLFTMFNFPLPKGVRGNIMSQAQSGLPYTVITGRDDNGDGVSNDRPAGVGRNTARGSWRWDLNARISRGFGFGGDRPEGPGGGAAIQRRIGGDGDGGGPMMMMMEQSAQRFRVDFYVQGYNLLNRTNFMNFGGNLQSPFFGRPSSAGPARRVEVGMQFAF